jgi:hypothetical protein
VGQGVGVVAGDRPLDAVRCPAALVVAMLCLALALVFMYRSNTRQAD